MTPSPNMEEAKGLPAFQHNNQNPPERDNMTDVLSHEEQPSEVVGGEGHGLLTLPNGRSIPFKAHPLADLFPMMSADEMAALVEDVRERGVQRPIVLLDGMVLDGRNRYLAARDAGVGYRVVEFTGTDPVGFVISENLRRRHLTDAQRQMVGARIAKLPKGANQHSANALSSPTQSQTAQMLGVSVDGIKRAKAVVEGGSPELVAAVDAGTITVSAAAEVAKLPEADQAEIVAQGPAAVRAAAKESRAPKVQAPAEKRPANGLGGLTREALEDEVIGLREENADLRKKDADAKAEVSDLKARLKEATADDQGKVIGSLQKQVQAAKYARDEALAATKRMEFKLKKAEARVKELEQAPIDMSDAR